MNKVEVAINFKIASLIKVDMDIHKVANDKAYANVIKTQLYTLIKDPSTKLYLEPKEYIEEAYRLEVNASPNEMLKFIGRI